MRNIPSQLAAHKRQSGTTICWLIRIATQDGQVIGLTTLDRDVTFDDGFGALKYLAPIGFQPANIAASADAGVDTAEFQSLVMPEYETAITEEAVNAGVFDYASFTIYEVNYMNLSQGAAIVMDGTLGQARTVDGVTIFGELRSLLDSFRRQLCQVDSRTCRALFGSQAGEERYPCGYDTTDLWVEHVVTEVGLENNRTFKLDLSNPDYFYVPGLIQFLSGRNAGKTIELERQLADGTIDVRFTTPYPVQVGDRVRIRMDCSKFPNDDAKGCKKWFGPQWVNHFRGEPYIPVGDEGTLLVPGSAVGPGYGGATSDIPED